MTLATVCDEALLYSTKKDRSFHKVGQTRTTKTIKNVSVEFGINKWYKFSGYNPSKIINTVLIFETVIFMVMANLHLSAMRFFILFPDNR